MSLVTLYSFEARTTEGYIGQTAQSVHRVRFKEKMHALDSRAALKLERTVSRLLLELRTVCGVKPEGKFYLLLEGEEKGQPVAIADLISGVK